MGDHDFENQAGGSHWLAVHLVGDDVKVNRSAIGAQVRIAFPDATLTRQVEAGTGESNQNDLVLHFGLGARTGPVDLTIAWPGGNVQKIPNVEVDRRLSVRFGDTR